MNRIDQSMNGLTPAGKPEPKRRTKDLNHEPTPTTNPTTIDHIKAPITPIFNQAMTAALIVTAPDTTIAPEIAPELTITHAITDPDITIALTTTALEKTVHIAIAHEIVPASTAPEKDANAHAEAHVTNTGQDRVIVIITRVGNQNPAQGHLATAIHAADRDHLDAITYVRSASPE